MKDDQGSFNGEIFATSARGKVPPLVSTKCRIQDDGIFFAIKCFVIVCLTLNVAHMI